jgi:hypothetical protein
MLFVLPAARGYAKDFPVYDALLYLGKPDLAKQGLRPIAMVYDGALWKSGESRERLNSAKISAVAKSLDPTLLTCVDIEDWPTAGKPELVQSTIAKYVAVISLIRRERSGLRIGYYGILPRNDYHRAIKRRGQREYDEWLLENSMLKEIARAVDVIFPSLYTFYPDPKGWETYAIENLKEARKYGKPVYAFLWPEYHDSNLIYRGQYIPADFWRLELETCYKYADGIVIWGGWQEKWDDNAEWWTETRKFMQKVRRNGRWKKTKEK